MSCKYGRKNKLAVDEELVTVFDGLREFVKVDFGPRVDAKNAHFQHEVGIFAELAHGFELELAGFAILGIASERILVTHVVAGMGFGDFAVIDLGIVGFVVGFEKVEANSTKCDKYNNTDDNKNILHSSSWS